MDGRFRGRDNGPPNSKSTTKLRYYDGHDDNHDCKDHVADNKNHAAATTNDGVEKSRRLDEHDGYTDENNDDYLTDDDDDNHVFDNANHDLDVKGMDHSFSACSGYG